MPQVRVGWRSGSSASISYLLSSLSSLSTPTLDAYASAGACAAFSLRKVNSAYSGYAIRVRRGSDNAEQNIGFDASGNLDTASLLAFAGTASAYVTTWYDQSGSGKDATQATAARQPYIASAGTVNSKNSRPAIKFGGSGIYLAALGIATAIKSSFTVFCKDTANFGGPVGGQTIYPSPWKYRNNGNSNIPYSSEKGGFNGSGGANNIGQGDAPFPSVMYANNARGAITSASTFVTLPSATGLNLISYFVPGSQEGTKNIGIGVDPYDVQNWGLVGSISEILFFATDLSASFQEINAGINSYYSIYAQDANPVVAGAYSLRKLRQDYAGKCLRVRRSNDNAESDIGFDSAGNISMSELQAFVGWNNQASYSDSLSGSGWAVLNNTMGSLGIWSVNAATGPDGTFNATRIAENGWGVGHTLYNSIYNISAAGTSWNTSVYVKKGTGTSAPRYFALTNTLALSASANDVYVVFDLDGATASSATFSTDTNTGWSMTSVGNGWYRCAIWGTTTTATSRPEAKVIRFTKNSPTMYYPGYAGTTEADLYVWGFQYSRGTNTDYLAVRDYTKTTTTTAGHAYVVKWYDQSGNGRDKASTTAAYQPVLMIDGFIQKIDATKPGILFQTKAFDMSAPSVGNYTTSYIVFKMDPSYSATGNYTIYGGPTYEPNNKFAIVSNKYYLVSNSVSTTAISSTASVYAGINCAAVMLAPISKVRINGTEVISGNIANQFGISTTNLWIGRSYGSTWHLGYISDIIFYNAEHNSPTAIESSLRTYYSV